MLLDMISENDLARTKPLSQKVENAGHTMQEIESSVKRLSDIIGEIATAS